MNYLQVKNWEQFQHYKERNPPWIKLHRDLLRNYDFICLQDASKLHLMLIWLLASQLDNKIPADENYIKTQIGVNTKINFKELIDKGFLVDASNTLAGRKQSAIPETEAYSKETEAEIESAREPRKKSISRKTRLPEDWILPQEWGEWAETQGLSGDEILIQAEKFKDRQQSQGAAYSDWQATWRNWIRNSIEWKKK